MVHLSSFGAGYGVFSLPDPSQPSFKQLVVQDHCHKQNRMDSLSLGHRVPATCFYSTNKGIDNYTTFNNDDIPVIDEKDLTDISLFEHLYLIGKCVIDWQITGKVSIVDIGKGFSLAKFTNAKYCNRVHEEQPWFLVGRPVVRRGGKNLIQ